VFCLFTLGRHGNFTAGDTWNSQICSSSPSDEIPEEEWFRYFKSLNKSNKNVDSSFLNKLKDLENVKIFTELDNRISNKEIINAIASLKNNNASSFDQILNEMLKFGQTYIIVI
jgi:hypothetical protein